MNEQIYRKLEFEEVHTLILTLETNVQAARDRLRNCLENFEKLSREITVSQICDSAGFMRKVSIGQNIRTIHDVNGFLRKDDHAESRTLPS